MLVFIPIQRKAMPKNAQTTTQLHSSHMLISNAQNSPRQASNNTTTVNFQMFKLGLEKAKEPEIRLPTSTGSSKKQESSRKTSNFFFVDYAKVFECVDHNKLENSERDGNTRPPDLPLEKPVCRPGSNCQNWTWNNRLVPNRKRRTSRLYIATLLI